MLHPEIIKYLYTFAAFFEKAKSAKIKIQGCRVILLLNCHSVLTYKLIGTASLRYARIVFWFESC